MVLIDGRPSALDALFRPGNTFTLTLTWPAGALAGRSFVATLDAVALDLAVVGDVMTITASEAQTAAAASSSAFVLTETTGGATQDVLVGTWVPSNRPGTPTSLALTVTVGANIVEVSVSGESAVEPDVVEAARLAGTALRIPSSAMVAGANTPTQVTGANGLPGWSLDFADTVVMPLPDLPVTWEAVEFEVIYSLGTGAGGTFAWVGEVRRGAIANAATVDTAVQVQPGYSVAASWADVSLFSVTARYTAAGGLITATGPAADTSTDPDVLLPVADRRTATALEIGPVQVFGTAPLIVHEVRIRDNTHERLCLALDLIGSWWTRPRTTVNAAGKVFVGGMKATGQIAVGEADLSTTLPTTAGAAEASVSTIEEDDHNNPALVVPSATLGPLVFYAGHAVDQFLYYRIGTGVEDVDGLGVDPQQTIDMGAGNLVTYAEVHARPAVGAGEVHVLTRAPTHTWRYVRSVNWAAAWGAPVALWKHSDVIPPQTYVASSLLADGRTLRCVAFLHPSDGLGNLTGEHHIWAWEIDLQTGAVTPVGGGATLGNVQSGTGLPLAGATAPRVYTCPAGRTTHVFDVSSGATPMIVFAEKDADNATTENSVYKVARWTGTEWVVTQLADTGQHFGWSLGFYVGGGAFSRLSDSVLYLSREHDGIWTIEKLTTATGWLSWTTEIVDLLDQPLVRPFAVDGDTSEIDVTYYRLHRYEGFASGQFFADLYGA